MKNTLNVELPISKNQEINMNDPSFLATTALCGILLAISMFLGDYSPNLLLSITKGLTILFIPVILSVAFLPRILESFHEKNKQKKEANNTNKADQVTDKKISTIEKI